MPYASEEFFDYLRSISFRDFTLRAPLEGSLIFAGEPILIIEGPLGACQLVETTLLVLVNFATLLSTNACRMRVAASPFFLTPSTGVNRLSGQELDDRIE